MLSIPLGRAALLAAATLVVGGCNDAVAPPSSRVAQVRPATAATTAPTTAPSGPAAAVGSPVAHLNGLTITRGQLDEVLYRSYGINLLADLVYLDLAKQALAAKGMTLSDADTAAERQRSMEKLFAGERPENFDADFKQLKAREHLTDAEFELGFERTAALRKLAHPQVAGQVSDDAVHKAFGILYGENRVISDITVQNVAEAAETHRRLAAGEPWGTVVREMSIDVRTRANNGQWPPFSTRTPGVPTALMEAAFAMRPGDVSHDVIAEGSRYHVVKLLAVVPPKLVRYDEVKADVRRQVEDQLEQQFINQLKDQLKQVALAGLRIDDPTLRGSWDAMIAAQQPTGQTLSAGDATAQIHRAEGPAATRPTP